MEPSSKVHFVGGRKTQKSTQKRCDETNPAGAFEGICACLFNKGFVKKRINVYMVQGSVLHRTQFGVSRRSGCEVQFRVRKGNAASEATNGKKAG